MSFCHCLSPQWRLTAVNARHVVGLSPESRLKAVHARHVLGSLRLASAEASAKLPDAYDPAYVENKWLAHPVMQHYPPKRSNGRPFTMMLPPPNVTGKLHLGHALTIAVQDSLARWHRLNGREVLWLPGSDHAGIATQSVVERQIYHEQGLTRHDLGREKLVQAIKQWREDTGTAIFAQMRRLGASLDWTRTTFTLDDGFSKAVQQTFITLFEQGRIYRADRIVNWSPHLQSALSDIEVDNVELTGPQRLTVPTPSGPVTALFGQIHTVIFPHATQPGKTLQVATTRPETLPGDVALAVHPSDERYAGWVGESVRHPVTGLLIPVVADDAVQPDFGSGVVKVTPAHDAFDFALGQRHGLAIQHVIGKDGCMLDTSLVPEALRNVSRLAAREQIVRLLKADGFYGGAADHAMTVPVCSRSGDVIEPLLSPQWFLDCQDMASDALEAVDSGKLTLVPSQHQSAWRRWLGNIQPWCISRQLWWGHRIPAYRYTLATEKEQSDDSPTTPELYVAAADKTEALHKITAKHGVPVTAVTQLEQDPDVLDTWFSSSLYPFASLGWPNTTSPDLARYFPNTLLETGSDILFFWVARMVMMASALTGQLPFQTVLLHPMVRDHTGRKMSKSLGNVIDPLDVIHGKTSQSTTPSDKHASKGSGKGDSAALTDIPACGADALRLTLLSYMDHGIAINMDLKRVVANRKFGNKFWQAGLFVKAKLKDHSSVAQLPLLPTDQDLQQFGDQPIEQWLLSSAMHAARNIRQSIDSYRFAPALEAAHDQLIDCVCDVYLEYFKSLSPEETRRALPALVLALKHSLVQYYPSMPFITEELYSWLPRCPGDPEYLADVEGIVAFENCALARQETHGMEEALALGVAIRQCPLVAYGKGSLTQRPRIAIQIEDGQAALPSHLLEQLLQATCAVQAVIASSTPPPSVESAVAPWILIPDQHPGFVTFVQPAELDLERLEQQAARLRKSATKEALRLTRLRARLADDKFRNRCSADVYAQEVATANELDLKLKQMIRTNDMYSSLLPCLDPLVLEYDEAWSLDERYEGAI
eukprot:m.64167 g.64167  ORF g.64167 m.64167 type:complete len:1049 (+) comp13995_c0_seq2:88-3234(+)